MPALVNRLLDGPPLNDDLDLCLGLFSFLGEDHLPRPEAIFTQLRRLEGPDTGVEVLEVDQPVIGRGSMQDVHWVKSDNLQLSWIYLPDAADRDIEALTEQAYDRLLRLVHKSEYPELVRFWNFLPQINHGSGDFELYKRFCKGRLNAFNTYAVSSDKFPAASALGHYQHGLTIALLSSHTPAEHIHNPRQVNAYQYPRDYGSSSPSFARASRLQVGGSSLYFISGTASIVGHESVHIGELEPQIRTTVDNINCLLKLGDFDQRDINLLRVYLRNVSDQPVCARLLDSLFPGVPKLYLHADVCRAELLVEIECLCSAD
ncbi:MAG: hypothetical protein AAGC91_01440 [Pseudomonadota bacterium]